MKNWILVVFVLALTVTTLQAQQGRNRARMNYATMQEGSAATYESLATAIVAIRNTENQLVKGILEHSYFAAMNHLQAAMGGGGGKAGHLEAAATEITNIANEGDKRIQAVRQRLVEAGHHHHHHHADDDQETDYLFIDGDEKKTLLALATTVAKLGADASDEAIGGAIDSLTADFEAAMKSE